VAPGLKTNAEQFRSALARHGRREVFHWTPASQLVSILQHGILSRCELERRGIPYIKHGYGRAGKEQDFADHVCVSFYPQKGMMKSETGALAVFVMDSEIVITEGSFYCPQNTAKSEYEFDELVNCSSVDHLDGLFKGPNEWDLIDWQAEVWIPDCIDVNYVRKVWFRNKAERDQAVDACSDIASSLPNTLRFGVGPTWAFPSS
jgi:ssDNA thymidine ADP-ribosyltransferase DarT-like protein